MSVAAERQPQPAPVVETRDVLVVERLMLTLSKALDDWLDDLERRDYSAKHTMYEYGRYVGLLCDSLPRDTDVSKVTLDQHIVPFLHRYRNRSKTTIAAAETAVCAFFGWLYSQRKISRNPTEFLVRTRRPSPDDLDVVTVSQDDVRRMLFLAKGWPERLAMNVAVYLGPRRHALAQLRITDYDRARGRIRFHEKGGKTIYKQIPEKLDALIEEAIAAGVYDTQDYLVPSLKPHLVKKAARDDQVILRIVKRVAERAGVEAHVHALRAAFACYYLEEKNGDLVGLKQLMGHKRLTTTEIYLRKMNREKAMEPVRTLDWGVAELDSDLSQEVRNLRPSRWESIPVAAGETPESGKESDRMGKGLAPNGMDGGSSG